jgi:glycosyltransferase involved in cell wall biosynthesis
VSGASTPLRVAQLVEALGAGGAEALAVDIAGALAARGHRSHLIVAGGDGPFRERIVPEVVFHDLARPRRDGGQIYRILYFLETCRRLENYLRSRRIEVLQTHLPKANFLGLMMAWRGVCRVYPTVHNNREFDYGDHAGKLKRRARRAAYGRMLKHCRAVIAVSEQVKSSLAKELGVDAATEARIRVVRNGVRVAAPTSAVERATARAGWGVDDGQVLIVGVGRLTRQKNFAGLIDALSLLGPECAEWRCIIAGDGELRADLEELVVQTGLQARVRLPGLVRDVPGLLAAADVFCLPSSYEGLPLVLLEAMSCSLPVVAFAIDGVTEVAADGIHGRLVPPGDAGRLAGALSSLVDDPGARRVMGAAARELVASRFGFETVVDNLETMYRS